MPTQAERRAATRTRILDAATNLFVENGILGTGTEAVILEAGVSRGALYHHFPTREDLIAAVYEAHAAESIARALRKVRPASSPLERLIGGCLAWLDDASAPPVARILIEDGPSALGWQRCREIEGRHSRKVTQAGLQAAVDAGELAVRSTELVALLLNAVLAEAALVLVATPPRRRKAVRADLEATLRAFISGLMP